MKHIMFVIMLLAISISCYAQGSGEYTLLVGEFENRTDIVNPLLGYLSDTLSFLLSRSEVAEIHPVSPGLRSAYLQRARNEQPNVDSTQLTLLAARYAQANAVLTGFYTKVDDLWTMEIQLYVMHEDARAQEHIQLVGESLYRLLDDLAAEVSKRLGTGEYILVSTKSWEAYEAYRQGHQAFYDFDSMGAVSHFKRAVELDPHLAIAHMELGVTYWITTNNPEKVDSTVAAAMDNLRYASKQEQIVVKGLDGWRRTVGSWYNADIPRMREDAVWDEPWLHWSIAKVSEDKEDKDREYEQWLISATAYSEAGFYGTTELASAGTQKCLTAFGSTGKSAYLDAAIQFISRAADLGRDDEYDDAWKHWELANIYDTMNRSADVKQHRGKWLRIVRSRPMESLSSEILNDIARRCLTMNAVEDATEFAAKAVELESNLDPRALHLVTLADAYLESGRLDEAFNSYVEAFKIFIRDEVSTSTLLGSLSGLTRLIETHPGFVDEVRRSKLDEIMKSIGSIDPQRISIQVHYTEGSMPFIRGFCRAMGDMSPVLKLVQGMVSTYKDGVGFTSPRQMHGLLSYLVSLNGRITEFERNWLSTPEFIQAVADRDYMLLRLGWLYEMIDEPRKAVKAYEDALKSDSPEMRRAASCALISLHHSLGDAIPSQPHVYLEAEGAASFTPYFEIAQAPEVYGGEYVWAPDTFDGLYDGEGEAVYEFEIPQPGSYRLMARVLGDFSYAGRVQAFVGNNRTELDVIARIAAYQPSPTWNSAAWEWRAAHESFTLPAGKHRLIVHNKDDGVKLDCMVLYRKK